MVDSEKRVHDIMDLTLLIRGEFIMATKRQKFTTYTEEIKKEVVRLRVEEGQSLSLTLHTMALSTIMFCR